MEGRQWGRGVGELVQLRTDCLRCDTRWTCSELRAGGCDSSIAGSELALIGDDEHASDFDLLLFEWQGYFGHRVFHVMGVTDMDDKILIRAKEEGLRPIDVAQRSELGFWNALHSLGVRPPDAITRVTEHMEQIVRYTRAIVDAGLAYVTDAGVYFDTREYERRGGSYRILGGDGTASEEVDGAGKKCAADFALLKRREKGVEAWGWDCEFGHVRPGWHIECSAMIESAFGPFSGHRLDVHSGGIDLRFPHHNNEVAQTCARHGGTLDASHCFGHFVHVGHVQIEGLKMSKSLKNFITVSQMLERFSSDTFRMFVLMHHYRGGTSYSEAKMEDAGAVLARLLRFVEQHRACIAGVTPAKWDDADTEASRDVESTRAQVEALLADDMRTHEALHRLLEMVTRVNRYASAGTAKSGILSAAACCVERFLTAAGVSTRGPELTDARATAAVDAAVSIRSRVKELGKRVPRDLRGQVFEVSDWARDAALHEAGVELKDAPDGTTTWSWRRNQQ